MSQNRLVIAGTGSGVGKTTLTIGIMAALKKRGLAVQGFKCGPDYIDPSYHTAVSGRKSRNLDSWMLPKHTLKEVLHKGSHGADISIIEGVMGFYDGKDPTSDEGSTAHISVMTESPVLLVVQSNAMARSAAAIVKGFQLFNEDVNIVGVIANQVGSEGHYQLVKKAIEQECDIPVVGYLTNDADLTIPERHLGLIPSIERGELTPFFDRIGKVISKTIDLDQLYDIALTTPAIDQQSDLFKPKRTKVVKLAVARDEAFNFYYEENLELLEAYGAELICFSPLAGETLPKDVQGLYIGGGFPEEFAERLSQLDKVKTSIKEAIDNGMPTFAECGGFMYLCESMITSDKREHPMVGVLPGVISMTDQLAGFGYREVGGLNKNFLFDADEKVRGHEFHYSTYTSNEPMAAAFETRGRTEIMNEGVVTKNLVAGYTHLHFASCPTLAEQWVNRCLKWKNDE